MKSVHKLTKRNTDIRNLRKMIRNGKTDRIHKQTLKSLHKKYGKV